jgi:hypothetical protein
MTLMHPCFNSVGKKKGKQKFRSAEEARKARELSEQWEKNNEKWKSMSTVKKTVKKPTKITQEFVVPAGRETVKVNRLNSWVTGPVSTKQPQQYTGSNVLGISQMAKSNAVPIFNSEHIVEIARMRR